MKAINDNSWAKFHIYDLFEIDSGSKLDKIKMKTDNPEINFVGRSSANNGVTEIVNKLNNLAPYPAGYLTLALGGAYLGSCFVQKKEFYTSQNVFVLIPKTEMSLNTKLFIATTIFRESQNNYKAFIKELNSHIKTDFEFYLPVDNNGKINETFIENFMDDATNRVNNNVKLFDEICNVRKKTIDTSKWKEYKLKDLFAIEGSTTTAKSKLNLDDGGDYPYVTTAASNNGVCGYSNIFTEEGGVITVDSAVAGTCLFQEKKFSASDHVEKLIPRFSMTKNIALFIITILNANAKILNYAYNEKRSQTALKKEKINLPCDSSGNPDWAFMEKYISNLSILKEPKFKTMLTIK